MSLASLLAITWAFYHLMWSQEGCVLYNKKLWVKVHSHNFITVHCYNCFILLLVVNLLFNEWIKLYHWNIFIYMKRYSIYGFLISGIHCGFWNLFWQIRGNYCNLFEAFRRIPRILNWENAVLFWYELKFKLSQGKTIITYPYVPRVFLQQPYI